jgi:hypothetical protein
MLKLIKSEPPTPENSQLLLRFMNDALKVERLRGSQAHAAHDVVQGVRNLLTKVLNRMERFDV